MFLASPFTYLPNVYRMPSSDVTIPLVKLYTNAMILLQRWLGIKTRRFECLCRCAWRFLAFRVDVGLRALPKDYQKAIVEFCEPWALGPKSRKPVDVALI
jgi:hypothetical protein